VNPFTRLPKESVAAWGEEKLITEIRKWLGRASPRAPFGIGDDCAVLPPSRGMQLITVDPVIYPRHFDDAVPAAAVGAKLLKRNLSDLAAMGGRPTAAVLALTLDARVSRAWLKQFYQGLARCALEYGVPIVGGDIAEANGVLAASLTLLGEASGSRTLTRTGAKAGDWIYVTGELGDTLTSGHHFKFRPRLAEGAWLAKHAEVRAMLDVSDGLAKDLHTLTPRGTSPALDADAVPQRNECGLERALTDGEDYELVFVVAATADLRRFEQRWRRAFPKTRLTRIGSFVPNKSFPATAVRLSSLSGYEHLKR
jgi:thiamine-monophosphate kinase